MKTDQPEALAILDEFAANEPPLSGDQETMLQLRAEVINDPEQLAALKEATHDIEPTTEDQAALYELKREIATERAQVLTHMHLSKNPLVQTREGMIIQASDNDPIASESPSWHVPRS